MSSLAFSSPAAALEALLPRVGPVSAERIDLADAPGRILAEPVTADRPSPAVDVSAMDGYAVRAQDAAANDRLPISAHARIGHEPPALMPRTAVHIVTGAPIPAGADAVIRREDVTESPTQIVLTTAARAVKPGTALRRRGENAATGEGVVGAGQAIDPAVAGALAAFGMTQPLVYRRLRVAILTTGDELLDAADTPTPWQLRDSNGPALGALLSHRPWLVPRRFPRAPDDPESLRRAVDAALDDTDALILTGGVSMGDRDFVPSTILGRGGEIVFHKVPQRPGKPVLGAILPDGRPILALPGNPVSVLVTARRMATAVLERLAGFAHPPPPPLVAVRDDGKTLDLWWHRLVRLTSPGHAELTEGRGSGDVPSAARSDGFVEVPPNAGLEGPRPYYAWAW